MKITVIGRKIEVDTKVKDYIEKKYRKFDKFFNEDADATVKLSLERGRHIAETTISYGGMIFRSQQENGDVFAAIDLSVDVLERQITKHKARLSKKLRENAFDALPTEPEAPEYKLIKTKRFDMKPIDVDEAILQMELLDHQFFVFKNITDNTVQVVYKRNDGNYGLIVAN
ncbi:MAG: ribosome-associated translation inhibitor RaiA [Ruminococcaceae bacterium]|nr:ribosome-associated translation inhibitor RaiA [Oscillospiraceae bacterium]